MIGWLFAAFFYLAGSYMHYREQESYAIDAATWLRCIVAGMWPMQVIVLLVALGVEQYERLGVWLQSKK